MFHPKKFIKLGQLTAMPELENLQQALVQAQKMRGCTVELPWRQQDSNRYFALAVRAEFGPTDPVWTLYEGEGSESHIMWSAPFTDVELLKEVISLSVFETKQTSTLEQSGQTPFLSLGLTPSQEGAQATDSAPEKEETGEVTASHSSQESANATPQPISLTETQRMHEIEGVVNKSIRAFVSQLGLTSMDAHASPNRFPQRNIDEDNIAKSLAFVQSPNSSPLPYAYYYPGYTYPIAYPNPYPYPQSAPYPQNTSAYPQPVSPYPQPNPAYPPYPPAISAYPQPAPSQAKTTPAYQQSITGPQSPPDAASLRHRMPAVEQRQLISRLPAPAPELFRKQKNYLLGQFLIDAGLISPSILEMALKVQKMATEGVINNEQAIEAVKTANNRGYVIDVPSLLKEYFPNTESEQAVVGEQHTLLLGEILVRAEVIPNTILVAVLKLQEVVRTGALTAQEACRELNKELASIRLVQGKSKIEQLSREKMVVDLLVKAGIISGEDKDIACGVQRKYGGNLDNILAAAGKVSRKTFAAANECEYLLSQKKMKLEHAMIVLNYCERSRVSLTQAIEDLGWQNDLDI